MLRDFQFNAGPALLCIDVDGTILRYDGTLAKGAAQGLRDTIDAGHTVVLATARNWLTTAPVLATLGSFPRYVVCSDGAVVMGRASDARYPSSVDETRGQYTPLWTSGFEAAPILMELRGKFPRALFMAELPDGSFRFAGDFAGLEPAHAHRVEFSALLTVTATRLFLVSQTLSDGTIIPPWQPGFLADHEVAGATGIAQWYEVTPRDVDKGGALRYLSDVFTSTPRNTIAIGDGVNDLGMFSWALSRGGIAIAMGQSPESVKNAASIVADSVDEGGLARILGSLRSA